jgi:hypothetical protein
MGSMATTVRDVRKKRAVKTFQYINVSNPTSRVVYRDNGFQQENLTVLLLHITRLNEWNIVVGE